MNAFFKTTLLPNEKEKFRIVEKLFRILFHWNKTTGGEWKQEAIKRSEIHRQSGFKLKDSEKKTLESIPNIYYNFQGKEAQVSIYPRTLRCWNFVREISRKDWNRYESNKLILRTFQNFNGEKSIFDMKLPNSESRTLSYILKCFFFRYFSWNKMEK